MHRDLHRQEGQHRDAANVRGPGRRLLHLAPTARPDFLAALTLELRKNLDNDYGAENWDTDRFGAYLAPAEPLPALSTEDALSRLHDLLDGLGGTYELLADEHSKTTLIEVLAYRLLGWRRVRLSLNNPEYWAQRNAIEELRKGSEELDVNFLGMRLRLFDLAPRRLPMQLFITTLGVLNSFVIRQYEYARGGTRIGAAPGDRVIDAGGCWGDTALYFAHEVGPGGRVFSFEFTPSNIAILERNRDLNPLLADRIDVVTRALWDTSGEMPASTIRTSGDAAATDQVRTITIDDFARDTAGRLDFIKMDIEGAELSALRGAEATLRKYRPALAIAIYHRDRDFVDIPLFLDGLGLGYRFYLDHFTIYGEETVLFATAAPPG
jgi:FkbM family methyltransferase